MSPNPLIEQIKNIAPQSGDARAIRQFPETDFEACKLGGWISEIIVALWLDSNLHMKEKEKKLLLGLSIWAPPAAR